MDTRKLISLRINSETCDKIDNIAEHFGYHTRSSVINQILDVIVDSLSVDDFRMIFRYWRQDKDTKPTIIVTPAKKYQKR